MSRPQTPPSQSGMHCMLCEQALPEGTKEYPSYFAQYSLRPDAETLVHDLGEEVSFLLDYMEPVTMLLGTESSCELNEMELRKAGWVLHSLCLEAQRRLRRMLDTLGEQERAAAQSNGATARKEG